MRLPLTFLAALAIASAAQLSLHAPAMAAPAADARVIVTFKADSAIARQQVLGSASRAETAAQRSTERAGVLGKRIGLALRGGANVSDRTQVVLASGISSEQLVRKLAADADVESAVIDVRRHRYSAPNDPLYPAGQPVDPGPVVGQWYLRAPAGDVKSSIDAETAWAVTTGNPNVIVAVLDTGVRFDHADLKTKLLPGYDMISDPVIAGDGDGRDADPSDPGDYVSAADKAAHPSTFDGCDISDSSWHGTQTASLVGAATGNGIGMASIGRNVRVLPLRVLGKCGGYDSDIQAAMRWAAGLDVPGVPANPTPAAVISMSLGSDGGCSSSYVSVVGEVTAAGVLVVAAAGNSAGRAVGTPANCPGVLAVGGLRHAGTKVGYSDLGPQVAISAPAGNCVNLGSDEPCLYPIITALNAGKTTPVANSSIYSDAWNYAAGTSFAAPLVAGTAALMVSARPALRPADLRSLLQSSARTFPKTGGDNGDGSVVPVCTAPGDFDQLQCYCTTSTCGAGMLDAGAALKAAAATDSVVARIGVSPATPSPGQTITLSAAGSLVGPGRTIASWRWELTDGGGIVSGFVGATNQQTAEVVASDSGHFGVRLTVTDDQGKSAVASDGIAVAWPASSGGGGALGPAWLAGLLASVIAVGRARRRETAA
ncbi:MAG TPA: S8 family serine peptidase [Burkholderiaceae bacterium]|nr:S8 family serine peptidase [Burkholderiaceae bacterium]